MPKYLGKVSGKIDADQDRHILYYVRCVAKIARRLWEDKGVWVSPRPWSATSLIFLVFPFLYCLVYAKRRPFQVRVASHWHVETEGKKKNPDRVEIKTGVFSDKTCDTAHLLGGSF